MGIREKIKIFLKEKKRTTSIEIARRFGFSRQYASQVLRIMANSGEITKFGSTRASFYALPEFIDEIGSSAIRRRFFNRNLKEHEILEELTKMFPPFRASSEHIQGVVYYAFTEMLNNAIEHSRSNYIEIELGGDNKNIRFTIKDFGIGVFRNVMKKRHLRSELEAMQDLLKGKVTTDPKTHTGEGIFFTSKAADKFILESFGHKMIIDNLIPDIFFESKKPINRGTKVIFTVSTQSKRHLNDIFRKYQSESGNYEFDKTEVHVKLFTMGIIYVSRSQARRILVGLEKFKKIAFDFDRVPSVGQAFADEIFRVFQNRHPEIFLTPINMNKTVEFMVERAKKSSQ